MKKMTVFVIAILLFAAGCSSNYSNTSSSSSSYKMEDTMTADIAELAPQEIESFDEDMEYKSDSFAGETTLPDNEIVQQGTVDGAKLITTAYMSVETKEFIVLYEAITEKVEELNGYIESMNVSSGGYYSISQNRYGHLTCRIPAENLKSFMSYVEGSGNVIDQSTDTQDVTLTYVDMESRVATLEAEQSRLLELIAEAETVDAIIALEARLSEIRYELESLKSQLRVYDNKVTYSTVYISLEEVERVTDIESQTIGEEIKSRLSDNFYNIGMGLRSFLIWLVSSLPYLVPVAVIGAAGTVIVIKSRNKRKIRKIAAKEETNEEQ